MLLGVPSRVEAGRPPSEIIVVVVVVEGIVFLYIIIVVTPSAPHLSHCSGDHFSSFFLLSLEPGHYSKTSPLQQQDSASRRLLAKRYVFHCFSAGLPGKQHISNEF